MTQYFFVDESGEPGLRHAASSPYYVLVMVQLPNRERIPELAAMRQELHLALGFEFHFYKMNAIQKELFYETVQPLIFRAHSAVLLKENLPVYLMGMVGTQLADMLAGAIRQHAWARESGYYQTFSQKVVDLWLVD